MANLELPCEFSIRTSLGLFVFPSGMWTCSVKLPAGLTGMLALGLLQLLFFPFLSSPYKVVEKRFRFSGLLKGEKEWGTATPSTISTFPFLCGLETHLWIIGVSSLIFFLEHNYSTTGNILISVSGKPFSREAFVVSECFQKSIFFILFELSTILLLRNNYQAVSISH